MHCRQLFELYPQPPGPHAAFVRYGPYSTVRFLAIWGLFLCTVLVVGYGLLRGQWLEGLLAGIALAMSVLPEEFPVVLTIFLALGAWRIAQQRVLTRRVPTIETLGAATVLCVDKTGTLTQNQMAVRRLFAQGAAVDLGQRTDHTTSPQFHQLAEYSMLASQSDPFDPMEKAISSFAGLALLPVLFGWPLVMSLGSQPRHESTNLHHKETSHT